eukprot:TRINITY_DN1729_c0_g1_i3.p2 TRINITY_DN1729_c0_g1~~TRINITY_DN1729_c0_g1_i3.p2  ORF type:complete len:522 (-),score=154.12 TRINITY_DN1729_c0_g1_i3:697-2262(-)
MRSVISRLALLAIIGLLATTIVIAAPAEADSDAPEQQVAGTKAEDKVDTTAKNSTETTKSEQKETQTPETPEEKNATDTDTDTDADATNTDTDTDAKKADGATDTDSSDAKKADGATDTDSSDAKKADGGTDTDSVAETPKEAAASNDTKEEGEAYQEEQGYYEGYEDYFDFEDLFNYEEGYDKYFDEDYFNIDYGRSASTTVGDDAYDNYDDYYDDSYYEYNDYMYNGLYDDYYYGDYYYEAEDYQDYEYYGDYGYYGVYDENGEIYGMSEDYDDDYEYLYDYFSFDEDKCEFNDKGEIVFNASMNVCDVKVEGADKHLKNLDGGIDGVYTLAGCHNSRPKYVRYQPEKFERVLWFSTVFGDWDIGLGSEPDEQDIIMYGGDGLDEERPNFINPQSWAIAADVVSKDEERLVLFEDYLSIDLTVTCSDGKTLDRPERSTVGKMPLLTADEMEQQYRQIYDKYGNKKPEPSINFAMVIVIVFVGMGVVLGLPYMLARRTDKSGKTMWRKYQEEQKRRVGKD